MTVLFCLDTSTSQAMLPSMHCTYHTEWCADAFEQVLGVFSFVFGTDVAYAAGVATDT